MNVDIVRVNINRNANEKYSAFGNNRLVFRMLQAIRSDITHGKAIRDSFEILRRYNETRFGYICAISLLNHKKTICF